MSATDSDMKNKALAPWFGGKRNLAPWIIAEAGKHRAWWELCCGSMSVTEWKAYGGYGNRNADNDNKERERVWFSPACVAAEPDPQSSLF